MRHCKISEDKPNDYFLSLVKKYIEKGDVDDDSEMWEILKKEQGDESTSQ